MKKSLGSRFVPRGVFWRQYLAWAVRNVPFFVEPILLWLWATLFFLLWIPGRRGVARNMGAVFPGSSWLALQSRAYRVFWNFACTLSDTARFSQLQRAVDWEFEGVEYLEQLAQSPEGALILTAHMGNYDLGSFLFAEKLNRPITMIRAPEVDPETQRFAHQQRDATARNLEVTYNLESSVLAIDLVQALRDGKIVAIQGDRVVPGVTSVATSLFGQPASLPSGPFALAMVTRVLVYPLFVARVGRRRYRVLTFPPFRCERTGRNRQADIDRCVAQWRPILEQQIRDYWFQWFAFEPFMEGPNNA
ncbi:MAG TPA: lysophospholipid acyltransferase family protein [Thermoanaerobaculia bacterium]|nr:lysophospholipid acyltransferase family protein [Thermoanaerobaculia bacterium]